MITIYWKEKAHYRREDPDDPLVQEVIRTISYQEQEYGESCYSIDWGDLPQKEDNHDTIY